MQFLQLRLTVAGAGLRGNDIYISVFPGGFGVWLLDDNGGAGDVTSVNHKECLKFSFCSNSGLKGNLE